jgi:hypothetical protein
MQSNDLVHRPMVARGLAPGGIWIRVCALDRLLFEHAVYESDPIEVTELDVMMIDDQTNQFEEVRMYFYDGDSGLCIGTAIRPTSFQESG